MGTQREQLVRAELRLGRTGSTTELRKSMEHPNHEVHGLQASAEYASQTLMNGATTPQHAAFKGMVQSRPSSGEPRELRHQPQMPLQEKVRQNLPQRSILERAGKGGRTCESF